jgi:hypothetical protein
VKPTSFRKSNYHNVTVSPLNLLRMEVLYIYTHITNVLFSSCVHLHWNVTAAKKLCSSSMAFCMRVAWQYSQNNFFHMESRQKNGYIKDWETWLMHCTSENHLPINNVFFFSFCKWTVSWNKNMTNSTPNPQSYQVSQFTTALTLTFSKSE